MIDILRTTGNKLRTTAAAGTLSIVALNSCAAPETNHEEEFVVPECAVHVYRDTDETYIQDVADMSGVDEETLTYQIEQLNSNIDIHHLSKGDDIALGATACLGLLDNQDAVYELGLRLLPNNTSTTR